MIFNVSDLDNTGTSSWFSDMVVAGSYQNDKLYLTPFL